MTTPVSAAEILHDLALSRSVVDRAAHHRGDAAWLAAAWADPRTRVVQIVRGRAAVAGDPLSLLLDGRPDSDPDQRFLLGVDGSEPDGSERDGSERDGSERDGSERDGSEPSASDGAAGDRSPVTYLAVDLTDQLEVDDDDPGWQGLRELAGLLDDRQAGALVHAVALGNWHQTHTHCPRCGARTRIEGAGHLRRCERDGTEHYPRTDAAVIMAVVDRDDRILLGRHAQWPEGRFSTLAGFVEPGESLEAAVRREVREEVGVKIGAVRYLGSQPWPFPSSLMLGFVATAESVEIDRFDGEIAEALWFTRAGLAAAIAAGEVRPSPSVSISRRLIEHWFGAPLPDPDPSRTW